MEWFSQNWVWVLFFAGMIAMHMFGHGGHGGHGGDSGHGCGHGGSKPADKDSGQRTAEHGSGHQH
jgi:hypothetical protein